MNAHRPLLFSLAALLTAAPAFGQMAISAKAGLVNAADGDVYLNDKLVEPKPTEFVTVPKDGVLRTAAGRVEVLLTPGAFLRMAESASFRLVENDLSNVVVDLLDGSALIDIAELPDENRIAVRSAGQLIRPLKRGIYLIDVAPEPRVRVYEGEATVAVDDREYTLKGSRELIATGSGWMVNKFDTKETDALYRWAKRRSEYIAMANVSAARSARQISGTGSGMMGRWLFNPFFGTMTYLPWGNNVFSPFGYAFFNPFNVYRLYMPPVYYRATDPFGGGGGGVAAGPAWRTSPNAGSGAMPGMGPRSTGSVGGGEASRGPVNTSVPSGGSVGGSRGSAGGGPRGGGR